MSHLLVTSSSGSGVQFWRTGEDVVSGTKVHVGCVVRWVRAALPHHVLSNAADIRFLDVCMVDPVVTPEGQP